MNWEVFPYLVFSGGYGRIGIISSLNSLVKSTKSGIYFFEKVLNKNSISLTVIGLFGFILWHYVFQEIYQFYLSF